MPVCQAIPRMQALIPPPQYQVPADSHYQHPMAAIDEEPEFKIFPNVTRLANNIFNPGSTIYAEPEEMQDRRTLLTMIPNSSKMVPKTEVAEELENPADLSKMATPEKWSEHLNQMASEGAGASKHEQARPKRNSPKTRLNLLIKMGVISDMEEVRYLSKKGNRAVMAKGKATTKGVLCGCCGDVISLSKFEAHAKSTCHRPAEHIFLADGRSLQECSIEAKKRTVEKDHIGEDDLHSDCNDDVRPDWLPAGWVLELRPRTKETHQIDKVKDHGFLLYIQKCLLYYVYINMFMDGNEKKSLLGKL